MTVEIIGCHFLHSSLSKVKLDNEEKAGVGEGSGWKEGVCKSEGWVAIELFH